MGFWIFMTVMNLIIPCIMVFFGGFFMKKAPKNINYIFGYRTEMSMKNQDTWSFAHKYCGKIWFIGGIALLSVQLGAMMFVLGKPDHIIGTVGAVLCSVPIVLIIISAILTEIALNKNFDKYGNKRKQ
ncbi:MAG: SdpI family protein [Ruminococcus sp.]|nr:SdpI family protein [Ruminococcus sp.]